MARETTVLWTEITDFPEGWGIKDHAHKDYYHLFYFIKGRGKFLIGENSFDIMPGSFFLLPPNTMHGLEPSRDNTLMSYEIKFTLDDPFLKSRLTEEISRHEDGDFFRICVEYVLRNGLSHNTDKLKRANYYLCVLLTELAAGHDEHKIKNSELIDTSSFTETTIRIMAYIESNYTHHIYINDIAEYIEYSRNYMCLLFKKDTGITVVDYLNYVRIRKACEYIIYSDIGLQQISCRVGFLNLSHFNRTFKKLVGTSPSVYSKMVGIDDNNLFVKNVKDSTESRTLFPSLEKALSALRVSS